jgi:hypothetical protein
MRPLVDTEADEKEKKKIEELRGTYNVELSKEVEKTKVLEEQLKYLLLEIEEIKNNIEKEKNIDDDLLKKIDNMNKVDMPNQETALKFAEEERNKERKELSDLKENLVKLNNEYNETLNKIENFHKELGKF